METNYVNHSYLSLLNWIMRQKSNYKIEKNTYLKL